MEFKTVAILVSALFCFLGVGGQHYEGKLVRNLRQRNLSKRPPTQPITEDYYSDSAEQSSYIEGGNQWKPLYNTPPRPSHLQKYRSKPPIYSSKYQLQQSNNIYPHDFFSKNTHQQSTVTSSLLVADATGPSNPKPSPSYKKPKYQYVPKKNYNQQQYEVHEDVADDSPSYSTQNHYRYHDAAVVKGSKSPSKSPIKPSVQYTEMVGPEKHIHHVHYHDTMEEALKAGTPKTYLRNYRAHPNSRRPY